MEIRRLEKKNYQGKKINIQYLTDHYYDIVTTKSVSGINFDIVRKPFDETITKNFEIVLFEKKYNKVQLYGVEHNDRLIALLEFTLEEELNRLRIINIFVDNEYRHHKLGSQLMDFAITYAKEKKFRAIMLETESCNDIAITFYQKYGFELSGFDKFHFSNQDIEMKEIDFEMTLELEEAK